MFTLALKIGDKTKLENYQLISILPVISVVAEKRIALQLTDRLNNEHSLLPPVQVGFCEHHFVAADLELIPWT